MISSANIIFDSLNFVLIARYCFEYCFFVVVSCCISSVSRLKLRAIAFYVAAICPGLVGRAVARSLAFLVQKPKVKILVPCNLAGSANKSFKRTALRAAA